jgi:porphobilinogen synthase
MNESHRTRRLRENAALRGMLQRDRLRADQLIVPVFVCDGAGVRHEVPSMPGVFRMSVDVADAFLAECFSIGIRAYIVFGVVDAAKKDDAGREALNEDNAVCRLIRSVRRSTPGLVAISDLCLCEYTSHGHCGMIDGEGRVLNDATLPLLARQAVNHASAGADVVAPSGKMNGAVAAVRAAIDQGGFDRTAILSYSVKYASAFYGPFRDAADSTPAFGDRRGYQMDPARGIDDAINEATLDIRQGADMIMVKPALPYLDVLRAVRERVTIPVAAYHVSGEYAMIEAAARNGWVDRDRIVLESLTAIRRAGADLVITYHAPHVARLLQSQPT